MSEKEQTSQMVETGKPEPESNQAFQGFTALNTVALCIFRLSAASPFLTLNDTEQAMIHGALVAIFFLLVRYLKLKGDKLIDISLTVITIMAAYQVVAMRSSNSASVMLYSQLQQTISVILVIMALFVGHRASGKALPMLCVLFLTYILPGHYLPGAWTMARVTMTRMNTYPMVNSEGLPGSVLSTATNFISLSIIFSSVLSFIGTDELSVKIVSVAFGKVYGGPARTAVHFDMLMGMVNGSGVTNVVTTDTFTTPLMKQTGFDRDTAEAIGAVASNGGQIMSPIMGVVIFLMADATSLPYTVICLAALSPVALYYITLSTSIATCSHRNKIPIWEPDPDAETTRQVLKSGWSYFLLIGMPVGFMVRGFSTQRAALITIILCLAIRLLTDRKKFAAKNLIDLYVQSTKSVMAIFIACTVAGVIAGGTNITGLGLKINGLITAVIGGRIFIMGILTATVCIVLGTGLPTSAYYIVLVALVAPAMIGLGVATTSAHTLVLCYGVVAMITPLAALTVFAVVGISEGDMWKAEFQTMKMAISGFVIPFVFLYNTDLLMSSSAAGTSGFTPVATLSPMTATLGCMIMTLVLFGWFFRDFNRTEQVILLVYAVLLVLNEPLTLNGVGFVIAMMVLFGAKAMAKKREIVA